MDSDTVKVTVVTLDVVETEEEYGDPRDADREGDPSSWVTDRALEYATAYVKAFNYIVEETSIVPDLTRVHDAAQEAMVLAVRG